MALLVFALLPRPRAPPEPESYTSRVILRWDPAKAAGSGDSMRKARRGSVDEMRPEYDFASMKGGVRGKYVRRLRSETNLVLIEPDLAKVFPTEEAVNEALRIVLRMATVVSRSKGRPAGASQRARQSARR